MEKKAIKTPCILHYCMRGQYAMQRDGPADRDPSLSWTYLRRTDYM